MSSKYVNIYIKPLNNFFSFFAGKCEAKFKNLFAPPRGLRGMTTQPSELGKTKNIF